MGGRDPVLARSSVLKRLILTSGLCVPNHPVVMRPRFEETVPRVILLSSSSSSPPPPRPPPPPRRRGHSNGAINGGSNLGEDFEQGHRKGPSRKWLAIHLFTYSSCYFAIILFRTRAGRSRIPKFKARQGTTSFFQTFRVEGRFLSDFHDELLKFPMVSICFQRFP